MRAVLKRTTELAGRQIEDRALRKAAAKTDGLPFLIQLIGYHAFNQSDSPTITMADVDAGLVAAQEDMENMVLEATLNDLSDTDKRFLLAMTPDEDKSKIGEIAKRMGISPQYAGTYRRRLIAQGVIATAGRGKLVFAMPMLKDMLSGYQE